MLDVPSIACGVNQDTGNAVCALAVATGQWYAIATIRHGEGYRQAVLPLSDIGKSKVYRWVYAMLVSPDGSMLDITNPELPCTIGE